jgi:hypothetical protein
MLAAIRDPEARARRGAAIKAGHARNKAARQQAQQQALNLDDPES